LSFIIANYKTMTTKEIIKETETFTIEQKQQLAYYFLFSILNEDKKQNLMELFHLKNDSKAINKSTVDDIYNSIVAEQFLDGYDKEDDIYNSL